MKKLVSFVLVMILCFSLCMPAWAYDAGTVGITTTVSSAGDRTAAITSDGTLWMWGGFITPSIDKRYGGMDNGYQEWPVKIMTDVISVSCSEYYTAAIKKDGSLWMWGLNDCGQLGNGNQGDTVFNGQVYQLSPVKIMDGVAAVCCGFSHTAVIKTDGSLWLFGNNEYGAIGNNHQGNDTRSRDYANGTAEYPIQTIPVKIMDDVVCVSCGFKFTAAVKKDGTLWTWGDNQYGQLGIGERGSESLNNGIPVFYRNDRYVPTKILDDVISVSCGGSHAAALKQDGSLWIWGQNGSGCLGVGSTSAAEKDGYNSTVPLKIMDNVSSVNCGTCITAAQKTDGSLWMWGQNRFYSLIDANTSQDIGVPTKITDGCRAIAVGGDAITAYIIKNDNTLYGWGLKKYVGIGDENGKQTTPVKVLGNMALPSGTNPVAIPDVPSSWAKVEVETAIAAELVPEALQKNYTKSVSRADVAQMFINLIEQSSGKDIDRLMNEKGVSINRNAFTDTSDYAAFAANALGIINGTGNNQFSPDGTFTRSQIAAIINRVAKVLGVNTDGYTHSFTDVVGHWVDSELGWPSSVGIINGVGDNKFSPDTELTTEQAIAITYRAFQVLKQ